MIFFFAAAVAIDLSNTFKNIDYIQMQYTNESIGVYVRS